MRPWALVVVAAAAAGVVTAAAFDRPPTVSDDADAAAGSALGAFEAAAAALPERQQVAFKVGKPVFLERDESRARYAPVEHAIDARAMPRADAAPVARLPRETSDGTTNIVLVVDEFARPDGLWVRVRLPVLPNNRLGWVPRRALGAYQFVQTHLVVDLGQLRAVLLRNGRPVFSADVGVGTPDAPTPRGEFYVRNKLTSFDNPFYGPIAFGTSARSAVLTDWPDGGFVGIHGTNAPDLIPGRVSHGCIRLRNADIVRLARLMPVGTPVSIR